MVNTHIKISHLCEQIQDHDISAVGGIIRTVRSILAGNFTAKTQKHFLWKAALRLKPGRTCDILTNRATNVLSLPGHRQMIVFKALTETSLAVSALTPHLAGVA